MSEKLLKLIKESDLSESEIITLIGKKDLKTQEEIALEAKTKADTKAKAKADAKAKKKADKEAAKAEKDKTPPEEPDPIQEQLDRVEAKLEKLEKGGKVPGKTPSEGKTLEKGALPDSTTFTVQKNMFEVDI